MAAAVAAVWAVGCATSDDAAASGPRIIRLAATNFGYEPGRIEVRRGETIRFIFENPTDLPHELFIGSANDQAGHGAAHRAAGPSAARLPSEGPAALYVPPHGTGQLEYRFEDPATTMIGCHLIGHWESGMRAEIVIAP